MNPQAAAAIQLLVADLDYEIDGDERLLWEPIKDRLMERIGKAFQTNLPVWKMYALKSEDWQAVRDFNNPFHAARFATDLAHRNNSVYLVVGNGEQSVFGATYYLMHSVDGEWKPFLCDEWMWVETNREYALRMAQTQSKRQHDIWAVYQSFTVYRFPRFVNEREVVAKFQDGAEVSIFAEAKCALATAF